MLCVCGKGGKWGGGGGDLSDGADEMGRSLLFHRHTLSSGLGLFRNAEEVGQHLAEEIGPVFGVHAGASKCQFRQG
jgi:hypothetical protein